MTREQQRAVTELRKLAERYRRAKSTVDGLDEERGLAYARARAIDPPLTFKQIAEAVGITEAAVQQKLAKMRRAS
jgi:CRP-like cAMP-binding protein